MAINLVKNKDSLIAAWKDVLNDKTDTDWALFGYEGQSNDLKVVSSGSSGIEEMIDDLNSGKIMYAFLKVLDPKTSLPKCVLINWQGEGANTIRKGTCANHVREVANFFTGAHVTINARNEEEIEPQLIIDKVSKSSGSAYSFKAPRGDQLEPTKPVGTNYQRVNPVKEINPEERNQFWIKQEQEERIRQEEEKKKREVERQRLDAELKRREIAESAEREEKNKLRNNQILEIRKAEMLAKSAESKILVEKETERIEKDFEEVETLNKSEMLRQQRNKEAQELIGRSTSNARSIFEQNTAAGQMINKAPEKPIRNSIAKQISDFDNTISNTQNTVFNTQNTVSNTQNTTSNTTQNTVSYIQNTVSHTQNTVSHTQNTVSHTQNTVSHTQNIVSNTQNNTEIKLNENITSKAYPLKLDTLQQVETTNNNISKQSTEVNQVENIDENEDSDDQFSTIKRSPKSPDVAVESKKSEVFDVDPQNTIINNFDYLKSDMSVSKSKTSDTTGPLRLVTEQQLIDEVVYQDMDEDLGLRARALYDYQAADETEITFDPGDIITHIDQIDEGWWQGLGPDGTSYGLFPANYVELIP